MKIKYYKLKAAHYQFKHKKTPEFYIGTDVGELKKRVPRNYPFNPETTSEVALVPVARLKQLSEKFGFDVEEI